MLKRHQKMLSQHLRRLETNRDNRTIMTAYHSGALDQPQLVELANINIKWIVAFEVSGDGSKPITIPTSDLENGVNFALNVEKTPEPTPTNMDESHEMAEHAEESLEMSKGEDEILQEVQEVEEIKGDEEAVAAKEDGEGEWILI